MSILRRLFNRNSGRDALIPLYNAIVTEARNPFWYTKAGVPDTLDGRFDMVAALLSLTLVRLESEGKSGSDSAVLLTEIFIDDMDGQLRQLGVGDIVVGKHIGKMMSALGGRLTAYRAGFTGGEILEEILVRNLYRGDVPESVALVHSATRIREIESSLKATEYAALRKGGFPQG